VTVARPEMPIVATKAPTKNTTVPNPSIKRIESTKIRLPAVSASPTKAVAETNTPPEP
jgi:hypothetical protein